jgi:hypothetical protein
MAIEILQGVQKGGLHCDLLEIVDVVHNPQNRRVIILLRHWRSQTLTSCFFGFRRLRIDLRFLNFFLFLGIGLIDGETVLLEPGISILPDSAAISGQIILTPDKVGEMHGLFFIFVRNFFPLVQIIFKLLTNEVGIVSTVDAILTLRGRFMLFYYLVHFNKLIFSLGRVLL